MSSSEWTVPCGDFAGRERSVRVLVRDGAVVIVAPAGEVAVLGSDVVASFRFAVEQAMRVASAPAAGSACCVVGSAERCAGGMAQPAWVRQASVSRLGGVGGFALGPAATQCGHGGAA